MAQPAPATAQNTNDDEDDEELCEEYAEGESPTLTLAPIPRVETTIDVNAKCLGPLRGFQGVKAAEELDALGIPYGSDRATNLDELKKQIKDSKL